MNTAVAARLASFFFVVALLLGSVATAEVKGNTPFTRAKMKGQRYTHRPYYKAYRAGKGTWFFNKK
ncbi:hypothetical protein [Solirubrum puertoriconensis]|uniref:Uncharacterized protein n=1 Tax=Solirubrum puertoriconensis TaxID=1751427 RepID=A0A9X0HKG4_SOLP1|nr:hypothetical protein [Solirubrum puertoriconensis]KUG07576.1 hypothetical protein ASU33_14675 [Solirubrum puertoriconensis]